MRSPEASGEAAAVPDKGADTGPEKSPRSPERELEDAREQHLRAVAEQENIRRIARRERDEAVKYAAAGIAADLLETADNLERAIASIPAQDRADETLARYLAGLHATRRALLSAFRKHGIERIEPTGQAFDPTRHEAVSQQFHESAGDGTVLEVVQPGYVHHERVLRPAMVVVARGEDTPRAPQAS